MYTTCDLIKSVVEHVSKAILPGSMPVQELIRESVLFDEVKVKIKLFRQEYDESDQEVQEQPRGFFQKILSKSRQKFPTKFRYKGPT